MKSIMKMILGVIVAVVLGSVSFTVSAATPSSLSGILLAADGEGHHHRGDRRSGDWWVGYGSFDYPRNLNWGVGWHHHRHSVHRYCRNACEDARHFRACFRYCLREVGYGQW